VLLPIILVITLKLINNKRIMGRHVNSRFYNIVAVTTTVILIALSITLTIQTFRDQLFPKPAKAAYIAGGILWSNGTSLDLDENLARNPAHGRRLDMGKRGGKKVIVVGGGLSGLCLCPHAGARRIQSARV